MIEYRKLLIGKKFGKLTVIGFSHIHETGGHVLWECRCECGGFTTARGYSLKSGEKISCGCAERAKGRDNPKFRGFGEISLTKWSQIIKDARIRGIEVNISIEQAWELFLKQNRLCSLSKLPLCFPKFRKDYTANASLDRIDSSKGYNIDNIQWVDKRINIMKQDLPEDEFIMLCKLIVDNNNGRLPQSG